MSLPALHKIKQYKGSRDLFPSTNASSSQPTTATESQNPGEFNPYLPNGGSYTETQSNPDNTNWMSSGSTLRSKSASDSQLVEIYQTHKNVQYHSLIKITPPKSTATTTTTTTTSTTDSEKQPVTPEGYAVGFGIKHIPNILASITKKYNVSYDFRM